MTAEDHIRAAHAAGHLKVHIHTVVRQDHHHMGVIGQVFPYTPLANPRYMIEDWSFGIRDEQMQKMIDEVRGKGATKSSSS